MALRRPTLLYCIVTIVLGVSFDNFSSPFSSQNVITVVVPPTEDIGRKVDIPHTPFNRPNVPWHAEKHHQGRSGDHKSQRSEEQGPHLDGCLSRHVDNVEWSEGQSGCPENKHALGSWISGDVLLKSVFSCINMTKHDSDSDGQQKQTGCPSVRLKRMASDIAGFTTHVTEKQSIVVQDDPSSMPTFEQERSGLYLNKMAEFDVCVLKSAPRPDKSIDLTRFCLPRPNDKTDHGQSAADLSKFKPDIEVLAFLEDARGSQPNGSTLYCSFRPYKSEGLNTSFSPKDTFLYNISLVNLWNEGRRGTKKETICGRELTLLCMWLSLELFRNEKLRHKVLAPLFHAITRTTSVKSLIKEALQRILALPDVKGVLSHHDLGKEVSNDPVRDSKKDRLHSLPDEDIDFGRTPKFYPDGRSVFEGTPKVDVGRDTHGKFTEDVSWLTSFSFLRPRPVSLTWPASFLPSMGSSPHDMSHLGCRLASLHSLPSSCDVSRVRLAQTGFYYDNSKTTRDASNVHEVTCFSCGLSYSQWKKGDNPETIHQQLKPDCEHLITSTAILADTNNDGSSLSSGSMSFHSTSSTSSSMSSGYGSMNEESVGSPLPSVPESPDSLLQEPSLRSTTSSPQSGRTAPAGTDNQPSLTGTHPSRYNNNGDLATDCAAIVPASVTSITTNQMPMPRTANVQLSNQSSSNGPRDPNSANDLEDRPPLRMEYAVYPQFARLQDREATFANWPLPQYFPPQQLVMQGFYFAGYADCIRCFYCGVGLKSWAENDDVMTEHIRYRSTCGYVLNTKGRPFVNSVLARIESRTTENGQVTQTSAAVSRDASTSSVPTNTTATTSSSSSSSSSPPVTSSAASSTAGGNVGVGADVMRTVADMGFSQDHIARAVRILQESGEGSVNVDSLIEKLIEMTTDGEDSSANGAAGNDTDHNNELQADGPGDTMAADADSERARQLALENERLRTRHKCKTCFQEKVGMIFLPCGHIVACTGCGSKLRHCTKCGDYIRATANVYL